MGDQPIDGLGADKGKIERRAEREGAIEARDAMMRVAVMTMIVVIVIMPMVMLMVVIVRHDAVVRMRSGHEGTVRRRSGGRHRALWPEPVGVEMRQPGDAVR